MSQSTTPHNTRGRKGSLRDNTKELTANMLVEMEERLKTFIQSEIASLVVKVDNLERKLSGVQTECLRLDGEINTIKKIISDQQMTIESHEHKLRANNIIIHNIPEDVITQSGTHINKDTDKIMSLCQLSNIEISRDDLTSVSRLGRRLPDKNRPIKLILKHQDQKFKFLNARKNINNDPRVKSLFRGNIFINADSSPLMRKEEHRLRQKLKEVKLSNPSSTAYIRSGTLYRDGSVVDRIDIHNQLC
jgi:hypothetical protein